MALVGGLAQDLGDLRGSAEVARRRRVDRRLGDVAEEVGALGCLGELGVRVAQRHLHHVLRVDRRGPTDHVHRSGELEERGEALRVDRQHAVDLGARPGAPGSSAPARRWGSRATG